MLAITSLASVIISGTASADCPPLLILLILVIVKCAITATLCDIHVHAYHTHLKEPES